jgi:hypothetical protein
MYTNVLWITQYMAAINMKKINTAANAIRDCESCNPHETTAADTRQSIVNSDEDDWLIEENESYGSMIGRGCAWCMVNHSDIPLFFISFIVLYLSINRCCYCVLVVAIISALMCMRFPLLNATLWSSLIVLYLHKDWNINFGNVKIAWNRS